MNSEEAEPQLAETRGTWRRDAASSSKKATSESKRDTYRAQILAGPL